MRFNKSSISKRNFAIDITPMIDVVFQLLIFALVTSQLDPQTRAQMSLPLEQGDELTSKEQTGLAINVMANGDVIVNDKPISMDELAQLVAAAIQGAGGADKLKPLIRADRECDSLRLNEVFNRLTARGLTSIRLATDRSK